MSSSLVQSTLEQYLENLTQLLNKLQSSDKDEAEILNARLFDDALPLKVQAKVVANFALRIISAIEQKQFSEPKTEVNSLDDLIQYVAVVKFELRKLAKLPFIDKILVSDSAGLKTIKLPLVNYVNQFALPNFFFHLTNVYSLTKQLGIEVSKGDFDSIHHYPPGFSWEQ